MPALSVPIHKYMKQVKLFKPICAMLEARHASSVCIKQHWQSNTVFAVQHMMTGLTVLCRRSYRKNEVIEENKALLKEKYAAAKALGKQVCHTLDPLACITQTCVPGLGMSGLHSSHRHWIHRRGLL